MATMVSRRSNPLTSSNSFPEKGSRNKRKFRADPPVTDPSLTWHPPETDMPEPLPFDKPSENPNSDLCSCNACQNHVFGPRENAEVDEFQEADWSDLTETQLEEMLLSNLDTIFRTAIRTVVSHGYTEEAATNVVLRSGVFYGCKDTLTNVVENALAVLRSGQEVDSSSRENSAEELEKAKRSVLGEMVNVLLEMRPSFSAGNAMWCLLISDMNVTHACAMDYTALSSMGSEAISAISTGSETEQESSSHTAAEVTASERSNPNTLLPNGLPNLPFGKFSASNNPQGSSSSVAASSELSSSVSISSPETKQSSSSAGKKGHFSNSKREFTLRQKSFLLEKSYRTFGSKAATRAGKHGLDKKFKPVAESNAVKNATTKLNKAVGTDTLQVDPALGDSPDLRSSGIDAKDEMLLKLVPRVDELKAKLQEWTDWAQQKVMQAARRLGKDKPELQSLRQEKEEAARLKKERQALEENTRKKLAEMEIALSRASSQVDATSATAKSLQVENYELRKEMDVAKRRAAESAASCHEVSSRETKTRKQFQSWEKQKALFHEELASEKRKLSRLQQQLQEAKESREQFEAKWKQEEKAKDEALMQARIERKEREQTEVSGRSRENAMRLKAETDLQRYKDSMKKLEQQIAQLRLSTDSSKIAVLKWGSERPVISKPLEVRETEEVQRERECVMCLSEEMSVVFLPCAHQVVCRECNELHEKQGMGDCPSCRTPIQRRICVRWAEH